MKSMNFRLMLTIANTFVLLVLSVAHAYAWPPKLHVFIADEVRRQLMDGRGVLSFYSWNTSSKKEDLIVSYQINQTYYNAIALFPGQYRAGAIGPDAYPDILTGQELIHPADHMLPDRNANDLNSGGAGPDIWMQYLYNKAFISGTQDQNSPNQAFVLGFLSHAAGDVMGHTFINYYTGGTFFFPENAMKHLFLEMYLAKRTPNPAYYDARIDNGVDGFIYRNMVDSQPGSFTYEKLLKGTNKRFSLPFIFSKIKIVVKAAIADYNSVINQFDDQISKASEPEKTALKAAKKAYVLANYPRVSYFNSWISDINSGLQAWPRTSHDLALALFYNPQDKPDYDRANNILTKYAQDHLLAMLGLPKWVKATWAVIDYIYDQTNIPFLKSLVSDIKKNALNYLFKQTTGYSIDELKQYLEPVKFNAVLNSHAFNSDGKGTLISMTDFNILHLHVKDKAYAKPAERFNWREVPAIYNSVQYVKLSLLSPAQLNNLLHRINPNNPVSTEANVLFGYIGSLDASLQYNNEKSPLLDFRTFKILFRPQEGDDNQ